MAQWLKPLSLKPEELLPGHSQPSLPSLPGFGCGLHHAEPLNLWTTLARLTLCLRHTEAPAGVRAHSIPESSALQTGQTVLIGYPPSQALH